MLSLDLFNSQYERQLREGAVDDLEAHRIDTLNARMQDLLARVKQAQTPEQRASLKKEYQKFKDERDSYYKVRETKAGQDIVDPREKMKALTPSKPGMAGAVKDVAKGLKNFLQGRPETGPTYEAQKKSSETVDEHGGGIGPKKHWQSMMPETQCINEIKDTEAVEQAILKRIMVAHRDMLVKYGPEKIMTAASDVAYNVGDIGEVGSSDVSGWVKQVEQILGAVQEGLRDPEDNPCWKGYHPVSTKKKAGRTVPNCVPNAKK